MASARLSYYYYSYYYYYYYNNNIFMIYFRLAVSFDLACFSERAIVLMIMLRVAIASRPAWRLSIWS